MKVIKRDGREVEFEESKILNAITKAYKEIYPVDDNDNLSNSNDREINEALSNVIKNLRPNDNKTIDIEQIQDAVENCLMNINKDVAKAYITYRYKRKLIRESNTTDKSILELIDGTNDYWNNENSNKNATIATTQRDYLAGITSTDITKRFLLPKDVVKAHEEGILHFHK